MHRTEAGLDQELAARLAALEQRNREWRPWLALLREAFNALESDGRGDPLAVSQVASIAPGSDGTPLLHGLDLLVDIERTLALISRLAAAVRLGPYRPTEQDALALVAQSVRDDRTAIEALATSAGVDGHRLDLVARLAAWPVLVACGRALAGAVPAAWAHGHCPVCGAWPLVVERRGLERARRLRCGRCAADWPVAWLTCAYCGERDHGRLGSLVPDGELDARRIETCSTCRGYLKSVSTLGALMPAELLLVDLETVELDLVAQERSWIRPPGLALTPDVRVRGHS